MSPRGRVWRQFCYNSSSVRRWHLGAAGRTLRSRPAPAAVAGGRAHPQPTPAVTAPLGSASRGRLHVAVCMFRVTRGDRGHASARGRAPACFLPRVTSCLVFSCALRAPHVDNSLPVLYLIKTVLRVSVFATYLLDPPVVPLQADHSRSEAQLSLQSPVAA